MTPLQNLPPKVREKINLWLKVQDKRLCVYNNAIVYSIYDGIILLPEPAEIGLLTAWLESEGWEYAEYKSGQFYKLTLNNHENRKIGYSATEKPLAFWQAFEKVTKIMETEL